MQENVVLPSSLVCCTVGVLFLFSSAICLWVVEEFCERSSPFPVRDQFNMVRWLDRNVKATFLFHFTLLQVVVNNVRKRIHFHLRPLEWTCKTNDRGKCIVY